MPCEFKNIYRRNTLTKVKKSQQGDVDFNLTGNKFFILILGAYRILLLHLRSQRGNPYGKLAHGVTGNTSGFGPEESRFEP